MSAVVKHSFSCQRRSRKKPLKRRNYVCILCTYQCSKHYRLTDHFRVHTKEKPFACTMCNYQSSFSSGLREHKLSAHIVVAPNDEKKFRCAMCNFQTKSPGIIGYHMKAIHINNLQEEPRKFTCINCGHVTTSMEDMKIHNESVHLNLQTADDKMETQDIYLGHPMLDDPLFDSSRFQMAMDNAEMNFYEPEPYDSCPSVSNRENSGNILSSLNCQNAENALVAENGQNTGNAKSQVSQNSTNEWKGEDEYPIPEDIKYPICELNSESAKDPSSELNSEDIKYSICELNTESAQELAGESKPELVKEDEIRVKEEILPQD